MRLHVHIKFPGTQILTAASLACSAALCHLLAGTLAVLRGPGWAATPAPSASGGSVPERFSLRPALIHRLFSFQPSFPLPCLRTLLLIASSLSLDHLLRRSSSSRLPPRDLGRLSFPLRIPASLELPIWPTFTTYGHASTHPTPHLTPARLTELLVPWHSKTYAFPVSVAQHWLPLFYFFI